MVETWDTGAGFVWDHVELTSEGEVWLRDQGLDALVLEALCASDTRPRVSVHGDGVLVVMRGVNLNAGAVAEDMISVRMWVTKERVISVWLRPLIAVGRLRSAAAEGKGPERSAALVSRLALNLCDTAGPVVAGLSDRVDALEEAVIDPAIPFRQSDLSELRRVLIMLKRYFAPQREAFADLGGLELGWISARDRLRFGEAADRMRRLTEELDALLLRAQVMQDHVAARRADHMNRQMYVLSVVAALFLPLGFVTGLLGINVGGMPGVEHAGAFWIVCAVLVMLGIAQWLIFRAIGIVGARRDQDF